MRKITLTALFVTLATALTGCEKTATDISANYHLPAGLSDCSIHKLNSDESYSPVLVVVRCPHSTVSTAATNGKSKTYISVDSN